MRVKLSANPPLPPVRAWFPLASPFVQSTPTVSSFKSLLCTSLIAFRGVSPSSLRLAIDGFELLDNSEFTVVRDGDLICIDVLDVPSQDASTRVDQGASHATQQRLASAASRKRKRRLSTPSSSSSESGTTESTASESESDTSDSETSSDSDESSRPMTPPLRKAEPPKAHVRERAQVTPSLRPKVHPSTFVPPGHGKLQTQARNLRRRIKRMHERGAADVSQGGPVTGANAIAAEAEVITPESSQEAHSGLLSLSLRNKNKAKNFKSLIGRPLPPKIVFGDQEGASTSGATRALPCLIPPSSRSSLPANVFVTSIDVEAGMHREKKARKMRVDETAEGLDYREAPESDVARLEAIADKDWATLEKLRCEGQVTRGMIVGYKGLVIDPATYTPEERTTVGRVVSCDSEGVVVRLLRAREQVSFGGPVAGEQAEETAAWADVFGCDWRRVE